MQPPVMVAVVGPTGSGKSELALNLAETFRGEIVNCDSLQLYRYMDIGTAKTPPDKRRGIPHHLVDISNPDEIFTAGDYVRAARPILNDIATRGSLPVVVGGTGFYLRALLNGLFQGPIRDDQLRERLSARKSGSLHRLLSRFDPQAATRIHPNDENKLLRALEVCLLARKPITALHGQNELPLEGFRIVKIGLDPPRDRLAEHLNGRCRAMFAAGLVEEVRHILTNGYAPTSKALEAIGYRQAVLHVQGALSLEEALLQMQTSTRQYAKRQRTWFRKEPAVAWLPLFGTDPDALSAACSYVESAINN